MVATNFNRLATLTAIGLSALVAGCSSTPAQMAWYDPRPLMNLVMTGQLNPSEYLTVGEGETQTPLCALLGYTTAAPAIDVLLAKGANVNQPCRGEPSRLGLPIDSPLDVVIARAIYRGGPLNLYEIGKESGRYRPDLLPVFYGYAEKLIAKGARTRDGRALTLAEVKQEVAQGIKDTATANEMTDEAYIERHGDPSKPSKLFDAETLSGLATIAGMAANNYAVTQAQRRSSAATSALPLADVKPIPPTKNAAPSSTAIGARNVSTAVPQPYDDRSNLGAAGASVTNSQLAQLGAKAAGVNLAALDRNTGRIPAAESGTAQNAATLPQKSVETSGTPANSANGFDALGHHLPKTRSYSFSCGGHQGEEMMTEAAPNNCIAEQQKFMLIQCFPGWLFDETNINLYKCAADKSTGQYKIEYSNKLRGLQEMLRKSMPQCNPEKGCSGREHLGII